MTTEQNRQLGRVVGIVLNLVIDLVLAYYVGKHFHSLSIGLVVYFVMARLDGMADTLNELKRNLV